MMALTLLLATGVFKIESEYSHKIWFRENDPYLLELDQFERNFGNDETIMLIVEPKSDLFSNDSISILLLVHSQPKLKDALSYLNVLVA